jgi:hypothetical protein
LTQCLIAVLHGIVIQAGTGATREDLDGSQITLAF